MTPTNQNNNRLSKEDVRKIGQWIIDNTNNAFCPSCQRKPSHFSIMPFLFLFPQEDGVSVECLILRCTDCNNCRSVSAEQLFDMGCPGLPFEETYVLNPALRAIINLHKPDLYDGLNVLDKDNVVNISERMKK